AREHHVRVLDERLREWIGLGVSGSPTFSSLLDRLAESDLIIYVQLADRIKGGMGGQMSFVVTTPAARYLRIEIVPDGRTLEMVALLGHELAHAVEIADAPCVLDSASMAAFYMRVGEPRADRTRFESAAARVAGERVRAELAAHHAIR